MDFVDIDPRTWNLSVDALKELEQAAAGSPAESGRTGAPCGQSCDMREIDAPGRQYGFKIVEDASHAIGGRYLGEPIGTCRYSDISVPASIRSKMITTAEGGMALTTTAAGQAHGRCGVTGSPATREK